MAAVTDRSDPHAELRRKAGVRLKCQVAPIQLAPYNPARKRLILFNDCSSIMDVSIGPTGSPFKPRWALGPGETQVLEGQRGEIIVRWRAPSRGAVYAIECEGSTWRGRGA